MGAVGLYVLLFIPYDPTHNGHVGIQGVKSSTSRTQKKPVPAVAPVHLWFYSSELCCQSFCFPVSLLFPHLEACGTSQASGSASLTRTPKSSPLALPKDTPTSLGRACNAVSLLSLEPVKCGVYTLHVRAAALDGEVLPRAPRWPLATGPASFMSGTATASL